VLTTLALCFLNQKFMPLTIYDYIASTKPEEAAMLFNKYGYELDGVETSSDLADMLADLAAAEGAPVINDLAMMHPDRELILQGNAGESEGGCKCGGKCGGKNVTQSYVDQARGDSGNVLSLSAISASPAMMLIAGGTALCLLALILKK
jgi:hypothetical protein